MRTNLLLQDWLTPLRRLAPAAGVLHVGAGAAQAAGCYAGWGVAAAVFVDAEESLPARLAALLQTRPGWSRHAALLSDGEGERDYYLASNPDESGVLPPESLAGLWRNLSTREHRRRPATRLDTLLAALGCPPQSLNWAVIDCLPALPVLRGAGQHLDGWDVIVARAVLDGDRLPGLGASKPELDAFLAPHGYRCLACQEERQPALVSALYARDWKTSLGARLAESQRQAGQLAQARDGQAKLAAERQAQLQQAAQARDEQAKLAAERQAQLQQATQARDEQAKLAAERQTQLQQTAKARDEQAKLAAERQAQLEQTAKARDEQAKLAAERQAQLQQTAQARDAQAELAAERQTQLQQATKARDEQAKLAAERQAQLQQTAQARDEQAKLAADRQAETERCHQAKQAQAARISRLESEREALARRQERTDQEMSKAEIQIELIKDLLLRQPGV